MDSPLSIIYVAAHGGYDPERYPLGGGAAIAWRLIHAWGGDPEVSLTLVSPGRPPAGLPSAVRYVHLPVLEEGTHPARLSHFQYARFCRRFEAAATEYLLQTRPQSPAARRVVLSNDISEGIHFRRVSALGWPIATIFHVDVVDYFCRIYLRRNRPPRAILGLQRLLTDSGLSRLSPDILRLVFEKQLECVRHSSRLILPSAEMAEVLGACYGEAAREKARILPWGSSEEGCGEREIEESMRSLRRKYDIGPESTVLLTLSRISPEKGLDRLLQTLRLWEVSDGRRPPSAGGVPLESLRVLICGEPAFMQGKAYAGKLRRLAGRLRKIRVFFPGHVGGAEKRGLFRLADLYVFPSRHESYGLTLMEAIREGVPVLASPTYGARELVHPGNARARGKIVDIHRRGGVRHLLEGLQDMLAGPGRLRRMKRDALPAGGEGGFQRTASALKGILREALAPDGASPAEG